MHQKEPFYELSAAGLLYFQKFIFVFAEILEIMPSFDIDKKTNWS
jgi:hypothetical protein